MKCPVCTTVNLSLSDRQGIEIDYCPQCRGVWLDRGELDKLIERSYSQAVVPPPSAPPAPRYAQAPQQYDGRAYYADDEYRKRKKKSFLGDMFDFD
jgi:Zn-finger nucleic acid-binding protein